MIFNIIFLPFVIFLGLITTYEDIRYGKVRNKWILLGLFWGLGIILFFLLWYFIASPVTRFFYFEIINQPADSPAPVFTVSLIYLSRVFLNAVIALIIAFLMWRGGGWAAGDAKLFFIYSLLIPLGYYWKSYLPLFPSFSLLINIFIPIFIYLLIKAFFYFVKYIYQRIQKHKNTKTQKHENKKSDIKKGIKDRIKSMGTILLAFVTIVLVFTVFQAPIKKYFSIDIASFQMFVFAAFIIFRRIAFDFLKKPIVLKIIASILIIVLIAGFATSPAATWQSLKRTVQIMIIFMIVFSLFVALIDFHISRTGTREIGVRNLKAKMNLDEGIINQIKKDKKFFKQYLSRIYPEGLTQEQAEAVKKWLLEKKNEKVRICKPFPFVLWMFIGVIITLILKSSLFHLILNTS